MASRRSAVLRRALAAAVPWSSSSPLLSSLSSSPPRPARAAAVGRWSSHSPLGTPAAAPRAPVTLHTLRDLHRRQQPIAVLTAHDFPSAHAADAAGVDVVLVGDSLAMVALGMADTSEVGLDDMVLHCRSVARATHAAFTVADLPMGSYEASPEQALASAFRVVKEGRVKAVKVEGGAAMAPTIARLRRAGLAVLAHVGLTPQHHHALGGFRVQGRTAAAAVQVARDAAAVQAAGAFGVVLEAVPAPVAARVTAALRIPTIGIGAGAGCSGQVLVQADMAGNFPPGRFLPRFVRRYGDVWAETTRAIRAYAADVRAGAYPAPEHAYAMPAHELAEFERRLADEGVLDELPLDGRGLDEGVLTDESSRS